MGMAMTVLSFAMLGRFTGSSAAIEAVRSGSGEGLHCGRRSGAADLGAHVKYYENLRVVFEIQTQLKEWTDQPAADQKPRRQSENEMSTDLKYRRLLPRVRESAGCRPTCVPRTEPFIARSMYLMSLP